MKIIDITRLESESFNPIFINALRQHWKSTKSFQCIGTPKRYNLILYLDGGSITYTDKEGNVYVAESGDVVYTPLGSEYKAAMSGFTSPASHTLGINFILYDEKNEPITLSDKILIFHTGGSSELNSHFERAESGGREKRGLSSRIALLEILSFLSLPEKSKEESVCSRAIRYLSEHIEENPSVSLLARECRVSEVYLRRKFKETTGSSPASYRNNLRLERAKSYLKYGDISIQEISDSLGYSTVSHFIKEFKAKFGISPLKYRKQF